MVANPRPAAIAYTIPSMGSSNSGWQYMAKYTTRNFKDSSTIGATTADEKTPSGKGSSIRPAGMHESAPRKKTHARRCRGSGS